MIPGTPLPEDNRQFTALSYGGYTDFVPGILITGIKLVNIDRDLRILNSAHNPGLLTLFEIQYDYHIPRSHQSNHIYTDGIMYWNYYYEYPNSIDKLSSAPSGVVPSLSQIQEAIRKLGDE
jgi:hypothetical protein